MLIYVLCVKAISQKRLTAQGFQLYVYIGIDRVGRTDTFASWNIGK